MNPKDGYNVQVPEPAVSGKQCGVCTGAAILRSCDENCKKANK